MFGIERKTSEPGEDHIRMNTWPNA